jgi:uncharacterized alpha-E superfamily protein
MLSRIADSLFWLNRYMERSEGMLRVVHTHYILSFDTGTEAPFSWRPVLELFSTAGEPFFTTVEYDTKKALRHLLSDPKNQNSIRSIVGKARENARGIQDHITKEVWEHVNQFYHWIQAPAFDEQLQEAEILPLVDEALNRTIFYAGISDTTMPRGAGWSFLNLGRFTERCFLTLQLARREFEAVSFDLNQERDILHWRKLLLCLSGYEHHLKTYRSSDTNQNVVDQVVLDKNFPRSIKYSLNRMEKYMKDVVSADSATSMEAQGLYLEFSRFNSRVQYADIDYIKQHGLNHFLEKIGSDLYHVTNRLGQIFFSYT